MNDSIRLSIAELEERSKRIFTAAGLSADDADIMTRVLLTTELRGISTHGFVRSSRYVECLLSGGIKPVCELEPVYESPSWGAFDGGGGLGIPLMYKAVGKAVSKAASTGVGIVNVRNSHHFGAAGYYSGMCAERGFLSLSCSNGDVLVAATGSRERTIGNNPFSYAAPAGKYGMVLYDIAMSMVSDMKITQKMEAGEPLPDGWIIDRNGRPSTRPEDYADGGVLLPFGGYKGYGMAMMVEIFSAVLSGAAVTTGVHAWNETLGMSGNVGHFIMALDVSRLMPAGDFAASVERMIDGIKSSEKAEGAQEILYPGELEKRRSEAAVAEGYVNVTLYCAEQLKKAETLLGL